MRQIVLDTETTGLRTEEGHRLIEIGCLEIINRRLTGKQFHYYFNPEREIEAEAIAIHGITNEFLQDKPFFSKIAGELIEFLTGAELIIHNAAFDLSFINHELMLTRQGFKNVTDYCGVIDTLQLARQLHAGQRNSLDALCKRYGIDHSKREFHGALLDAHLLAQVYLAMTGGQGSFFGALNEKQATHIHSTQTSTHLSTQHYEVALLKANEFELVTHENYLQHLQQQAPCLWLKIVSE